MTIDIDIFLFYIVIFSLPVSIILSTFDFSLCFLRPKRHE